MSEKAKVGVLCSLPGALSDAMGCMNAIQRFALSFVLLLLCVGCATEFQAWEGRNSVVEGQGGTKQVFDGMDLWTLGTPPRRFRVLGIIQEQGGMNKGVTQKAREKGGDAIILLSRESQASTGQEGIMGLINRDNSTYAVIKYLD